MSTDDSVQKTPLPQFSREEIPKGETPPHILRALPPVLFDSADLLVVYKPEGLASIPERLDTSESLVRILEAHIGQKLWVVHRLDKEVSGVIVFARTAKAHAWMNARFSSRQVDKTYRALVHGSILHEKGAINRPIRQFGSGRMGIDDLHGKPCVTEYTVLDRPSGFTSVEAHPLTGRRHQIRVHLYSIGHPIVGDLRYGERNRQGSFPRLMLHAHRIAFRLPGGGHAQIEAPLPSLFTQVLADIAKNQHS